MPSGRSTSEIRPTRAGRAAPATTRSAVRGCLAASGSTALRADRCRPVSRPAMEECASLSVPAAVKPRETRAARRWSATWSLTVARSATGSSTDGRRGAREFARGRASVGVSTTAYAYASTNRIAFVDPNGLHDTNGCNNAGSCMGRRAKAMKMRESSPCRRIGNVADLPARNIWESLLRQWDARSAPAG